jgi:hypothetical protein
VTYRPGDAYYIANACIAVPLSLLWLSDPALPAAWLRRGALAEPYDDGACSALRGARVMARGVVAAAQGGVAAASMAAGLVAAAAQRGSSGGDGGGGTAVHDSGSGLEAVTGTAPQSP